MTMTVPTITPDQRQAAHQKAQQVRRERGQLLDTVRSGQTSPVEVLTREDPIASRLRVRQLIQAVPSYGPVRAQRLLTEAKVHPKRRVGGLGARQLERLVTALSH